ncbi:MAG: accessory Sec system glycosylation chaperone GtfB, partial [Lachnospiraceae bacterium]|nr:accessory Sec system glycosylation chaperone GtfB [Lachnospiraceae bacterium]
VPDYWEISGNNNSGKVQDLSRERGRIFYAEPKHKRLVRVVDWYDERGIVRFSDHYNRYGAIYARTIFSEKGKRVNKSYFSPEGREIIVENFVTGDIILNEEKGVKIFHTKADFVLHFFVKAELKQKRIFFNSLSTPFFVSNKLGSSAKRDVLFWQESVNKDIPGNMQMIFNGQAARTATVMVQKKQSYDKLRTLGARRDMMHRLGFIYPFEKENGHMDEALICTNSDKIEHCTELVKALPQMHFHIAALTEMSSKLLSMEDYDNVSLYPGVKAGVLDELFVKCDYYFDINHEGEIVSAVRRAFLHNHLIFTFNETVHNRDYIAEEFIYPAGEAARMIADVQAAMTDEAAANKHLQKQREAAFAETVEKYQDI